MHFIKPTIIGSLALGATAFFAVTAIAEERAGVTLQESYAPLLEHPADRKLNLNYAALAIKLKDYESAIPPLERILINESQNAKIRLQVGVLYHLLHSDAVAKEYMMEAKSTPGASVAVIEEAEGYLHGM